MKIHIKKEQDITLTQAQHDQYKREWEQSQRMTTNPVSFETWVIQHKMLLGCNASVCACTGRCRMTQDQWDNLQDYEKGFSK